MIVLVVALLFVLSAVIAGLIHRIASIDAERKALLDRLLVANSIMPIADPPPVVQKVSPAARKIKFKLFP